MSRGDKTKRECHSCGRSERDAEARGGSDQNKSPPQEVKAEPLKIAVYQNQEQEFEHPQAMDLSTQTPGRKETQQESLKIKEVERPELKDYVQQQPSNKLPKTPVSKKKNRAAWIWPRGGRKSGKLAMFKDILANKGPDMYVAVNHCGKIAGARDGPTREQWSGWGELVGTEMSHSFVDKHHQIEFFSGQHRDSRKRYNYDTRRYQVPRCGDFVSVDYRVDRNGKLRLSPAHVYQENSPPEKVVHFIPRTKTKA